MCACIVVTMHPHVQVQWGWGNISGQFSGYSVIPLFLSAEATHLRYYNQILSHPPSLPLCNCYYVYLYGLPQGLLCVIVHEPNGQKWLFSTIWGGKHYQWFSDSILCLLSINLWYQYQNGSWLWKTLCLSNMLSAILKVNKICVKKNYDKREHVYSVFIYHFCSLYLKHILAWMTLESKRSYTYNADVLNIGRC